MIFDTEMNFCHINSNAFCPLLCTRASKNGEWNFKDVEIHFAMLVAFVPSNFQRMKNDRISSWQESNQFYLHYTQFFFLFLSVLLFTVAKNL